MTDISSEAERLAASYGYDADALLFQCSRRRAGSFALNVDDRERRVYTLAWEIAFDRQREKSDVA